MLDQQVFPDPQVAAALARDFVPVKLNAPQARELVQQYGIRQVPWDVVLDSRGQVLAQTSSPRNAAGYVRMLGELAAAQRPPVHPPMGANGGAIGGQAANREAAPPATPESPGEHGSRYRMPQSMAVGPRYAEEYRPDELPAERAVSTPTGLQGPREPAADALTQGPLMPPSRYAPLATNPPATPQPQEASAAFREPRFAEARPPGNRRWDGSPGLPTSPGLASYAAPAAGDGPRGDDFASAPTSAASPVGGDAPAGDEAGDRPSRTAPIAMEGFCPVTLAEQEQWQVGDPRFGAVHRGRTYLFGSEKLQERFLSDPDRFSPVLSGYDCVAFIERGTLVDGLRQHGVWYRGRTYLFADEASLQRFESAAEYYAEESQKLMRSSTRR
jgi:YHS domain-containing protein